MFKAIKEFFLGRPAILVEPPVVPVPLIELLVPVVVEQLSVEAKKIRKPRAPKAEQVPTEVTTPVTTSEKEVNSSVKKPTAIRIKSKKT